MADRRAWGAKDMVMTMIVVMAVVALIALYGNNVSFLPTGGATSEAPAPVDVVAGFRHAQATFDFPVAVPADVPDSWQGNSMTVSDPSASREGLAQVGTVKAVRGGWLTPAGAYIELVETAADSQATLASEFGTAGAFAGDIDIDGTSWRVTTGVRDEAAWVRTVDAPTGMTTFLITGNATDDDFRTLARAVQPGS